MKKIPNHPIKLQKHSPNKILETYQEMKQTGLSLHFSQQLHTMKKNKSREIKVHRLLLLQVCPYRRYFPHMRTTMELLSQCLLLYHKINSHFQKLTSCQSLPISLIPNLNLKQVPEIVDHQFLFSRPHLHLPPLKSSMKTFYLRSLSLAQEWTGLSLKSRIFLELTQLPC